MFKRITSFLSLGLISTYFFISYYLFEKIFDTKSIFSKPIVFHNDENEPELLKWFYHIPKESIYLISKDQLKLHGYALRQNNKPWILLVHGYHSQAIALKKYMYEAYQRGFQVLAPDLRAHGLSSGRYTTMGWLEKDDIQLWIRKILEIDPDAKIILHGVSLGATIALLAGANDQTKHVVGIIDDCGFNNLQNILAFKFNKSCFKHYSFFLPGVSFLMKYNLGFHLKDASMQNEIAKINIPVFIIHGTLDTVVPIMMAYENYKQINAQKEIWIVEDCKHAQAYKHVNYFNRIYKFINSCLK